MATGAFGGAPYGATDRVRGVSKWGYVRKGGDDDGSKMDRARGDYDDDEKGGGLTKPNQWI